MEFMDGNWSYLWFWLLIINIFTSIRYAAKVEFKLLKIRETLPKLEEEITHREKVFVRTVSALKEAEEKEKFLLKMINDSMSVLDIRGFIVQRMNNAPKHFKKAKEEDVKPDKVNS